MRLRKERVAAGAFLVDGVRTTAEALRSNHRVRELFVTDEVMTAHPDVLRHALARGVAVAVVTDRAARALSDTVSPQGITAVVDIPAVGLDDALSSEPRLVVVLDGVADPGNAGTVIRTAAAAGADAVVFCHGSVDPYGAKCVRASAGALLHVPVVVDADRGETVSRLRGRGMQILATSLDGDDLLEMGDELRRPTAWLFGAEAHGLTTEALADADRAVRIPMTSRVESLNLAVAAAVCLYTSARVLGVSSV